MKQIKLLSLILVVLLLSCVFTAKAQTSEVDEVLIEAASLGEAADVDQEMEGMEVAEVEKMPTAFGLFWRNVRERISIAATLDPVKKAEKRLRYAEERIKIADYIAENSNDPKLQERAVKVAERADKFMEKVEAVQQELLDNPDKRKLILLKNIARHKVNRERALDKLESKVPAEKLEQMNIIRQRHKVRDENFMQRIEENENIPEEIKEKILEKREIIRERQEERSTIREENKELLQKAESGDEDAQKELGGKIRDKLEAKEMENIKKAQERNILIEKVKSGDSNAVQKLKSVNNIDRAKVRAKIRKTEMKPLPVITPPVKVKQLNNIADDNNSDSGIADIE
ncbi:MAG: DUF5667 domain-containing protein [bacterium]